MDVKAADQPLRRRRVRPYPLAELPRLLQVQVDLGRAFWQHVSPVIDGRSDEDWRRLQETLPGPIEIAAQEPYLFPLEEAAMRLAGALPVLLELLTPSRMPAVLAIEEALLARLDLSEALLEVLRDVLSGAPVRVVDLCAPAEVPRLLGPEERERTGRQAMAMDLMLGSAAERGWGRLLLRADLRLAAPPPLTERARRALWRRRGRLFEQPVTLPIEAGHGRLRGAQVLGLGPEDVVVLDRFGPRPVVGGPVWLRLGDGVFPAHLDGRGVTISSPFQERGTMMAEDRVDDAQAQSGEDPDEGSERLLRELQVLVTCEIGRVTMTGREVLELRPGAILPVGRPLAGPVDLCVGGKRIARGELVDVEGEIGVRITETGD